MRDYSAVTPAFWTGSTGRLLRGHPEAQIAAMYLMTCHSANMIGVFTCPIPFIAHETGMPFEGAYKGLQRLIEVGFVTYNEDLELVWVHEMARFQIADSLKPTDNRVANIRKQVAKIADPLICNAFIERYSADFHIPKDLIRKAPSKGVGQGLPQPLRSQEQEQEQKQPLPSQAGEVVNLQSTVLEPTPKGKAPAHVNGGLAEVGVSF